MSFFSKIFGRQSTPKEQPDILFGRYSDAYKSEDKYDAWDRSVEKFQAGDYVGMCQEFFYYLTDETEENVELTEYEDSIGFNIFQGSKLITGKVDRERFWAEAKIARVNSLHIGFMRRLIEDNYNLKFGRYCLDHDLDICIVFDSHLQDASPYKLYYGLKEIALAADKQDDLFLEEFGMLSPVNMGHVVDIDAVQKTAKTIYLRQSIESTLEEVTTGALDNAKYPGGITYLLLDTIYRLDFLTRPEGHTTEAFERMHRSYFAADGQSVFQKNRSLIIELTDLLSRTDDDLKRELYRTKSTFGIINATSHQKFKEIVESELHNMDWYLEHQYERVALAIPGYIVGHALFHFSLPEPDKDLLLLYYQVVEGAYFSSLGFQLDLWNSDDQINANAVRDAVTFIVNLHNRRYPGIDPNLKSLKFDTKASFAKSYLSMMAALNVNRAL